MTVENTFRIWKQSRHKMTDFYIPSKRGRVNSWGKKQKVPLHVLVINPGLMHGQIQIKHIM